MDLNDIRHLANLARIEMSEAELVKIQSELDVILGAVARVQEIAQGDIPATSHALEMVNVFRKDEVRPSLTNEQALSGAPEQEDERFKVPQILGEE
jgi:aspartyl-tRNA(Asn)/glutamyl-tRNA(Gln) amidotransferase subunit C